MLLSFAFIPLDNWLLKIDKGIGCEKRKKEEERKTFSNRKRFFFPLIQTLLVSDAWFVRQKLVCSTNQFKKYRVYQGLGQA